MQNKSNSHRKAEFCAGTYCRDREKRGWCSTWPQLCRLGWTLKEGETHRSGSLFWSVSGRVAYWVIKTERSAEAGLVGESEALLSSPGVPIYELLPGVDAHPGHLLVHWFPGSNASIWNESQDLIAQEWVWGLCQCSSWPLHVHSFICWFSGCLLSTSICQTCAKGQGCCEEQDSQGHYFHRTIILAGKPAAPRNK